MRVGLYASAVRAAERSVENNEYYHQACLKPYGYGHNLRMLVASARMSGMRYTAERAAETVGSTKVASGWSAACKVTTSSNVGPGVPELVLTLLRFGDFAKVRQTPPPASRTDETVPPFGASHQYAQAVAAWATGDVPAGDAAARLAVQPVTLTGWSAQYNFTRLLSHELAAYRAWHVLHDASRAAAELELAALEVDRWRYTEPPVWYYPIRQCVGTAQLLAGEYSAALHSFQQDLEESPENGWSLLGAGLALQGSGRSAEANELQGRARAAWQSAEVLIDSPCPQLVLRID